MKKFLTILIITIFIGCAPENVPVIGVDIDAFRAEDACRGDCPTTEESSIETNSNIEYQGCSGLEELIDDGLFMSDGLAIMQIQSQINMMSDQQCQGLIDKNNSVRESR